MRVRTTVRAVLSKETVQSIMNNRDAGEMRGNSRWERGEGDLQG